MPAVSALKHSNCIYHKEFRVFRNWTGVAIIAILLTCFGRSGTRTGGNSSTETVFVKYEIVADDPHLTTIFVFKRKS